jgi:putative cell wall-binding protein
VFLAAALALGLCAFSGAPTALALDEASPTEDGLASEGTGDGATGEELTGEELDAATDTADDAATAEDNKGAEGVEGEAEGEDADRTREALEAEDATDEEALDGTMAPLADTVDIGWFTSNPSANTFTLTSGGQLRGLAALVNGTSSYNGGNTAVSFAGKTIKVGTSTLAVDGLEFTPIGTAEHPFAGSFDGAFVSGQETKNVIITGIHISRTYQNAGLFGFVSGANAALKNITIATVGARTNELALAPTTQLVRNVGMLAGTCEGSIENCVVTASVSVKSRTAATLANPYVVRNVGGVVGYCTGDISDTSFAFGIPQDNPLEAGTVLPANLEVSIATNSNLPTGDETYRVGDSIGGIVGRFGEPGGGNHGTLTNCRNTATIWTYSTGAGAQDRFGVRTYARIFFVGGIAGYSNGSIVNCHNGEYKLGSDQRAIASGSINTSSADKANGNPVANRGVDQVGGIVGGLVSISEGNAYNDGSPEDPLFVINCSNKGRITGLVAVGGILGEGGTCVTVTQCTNGYYGDGTASEYNSQDWDSSGMVTSTRWNKPISGGIVGKVWAGTISYCANYARVLNIQSGYYMAGIAGAIWKSDDHPELRAELFACYNTGPVSTTFGTSQEQEYREAGILGSNEGYAHDSIMLEGSVKYHNDAAIGDNTWGMWSDLVVLGSRYLKGAAYDVYRVVYTDGTEATVNADSGGAPAAPEGKTEASRELLQAGLKASTVLNTNAHAQSYTLPANVAAPGGATTDGAWQVYWYTGTGGLGYPRLVNAWNAVEQSVPLTDATLAGATVKVLQQARYISPSNATVPKLSITLADSTVLVQGADFKVVSNNLPSSGLKPTIPEGIEVPGNISSLETPYEARIEGLGVYFGSPTTIVAYYGIEKGDFSQATVLVANETYDLGRAVFPQTVEVLIDGNPIDASEYDYLVYSRNTNTTSRNPNTVYDSAGWVAYNVDYAAYRADPTAYEKLPLASEDLSKLPPGTRYLLFDREAESYSATGTVLTDEQGRAYYPSSNPISYGTPMANDAGCVDYKDGSPAGLLLKVVPSASNTTFNGSALGYYVITALDLRDDCEVEAVSYGSATWYWDSEANTLFTKDSQGNRVAGLPRATFTGQTIKPFVAMRYGSESLEYNVQYELHYSDPNPTVPGYVANRNVTVEGARAAMTVRAVSSTSSVNHKNFRNYLDMFFDIVPAALASCTITLPQQEYTYAGLAVRPVPVVKLGSVTLQEGVDYTVSYGGNNMVNNAATCTITALSNLSGGSEQTVTKTFRIAMPTDTTKRSHELAGSTRYETAAAIAREAYPFGSAGAILCYGNNYPDSLSASSLAGLLDYPILTTEAETLTAGTRTALEQLSQGKTGFEVLIVGGSAVVSDGVKDTINSMPGVSRVDRISGENRYQTQLAVYEYGLRAEVIQATGGWGDSFVVATGATFADALSVAPYAARTRAPIFLASNDTGFIDRALALLHLHYRGRQAIIVGGTSAVSAERATEIQTVVQPSNIVRLEGAGRYETSREIARYCVATYPDSFSYEGTAFTTGQNYADALAGGVLQAKRGSVIILADEDREGGTSGAEHVAQNSQYVYNIYYLGGTSAVPASLRSQINGLINIAG